MTRMTTLLVTAALAACGSKSATPKTTPTAPTAMTGSDSTQPEPTKQAPEPDPKAELLAADTKAWETAKPVLDKYCATCHTPDGKKAAKKKLDHFDMSTYPPGGHHTDTIGFTIRDVLGISGKKATMPFDKPGSIKGDELAAIKAWTDAWEASHKAGAR